jgi:hypothetical protein
MLYRAVGGSPPYACLSRPSREISVTPRNRPKRTVTPSKGHTSVVPPHHIATTPVRATSTAVATSTWPMVVLSAPRVEPLRATRVGQDRTSADGCPATLVDRLIPYRSATAQLHMRRSWTHRPRIGVSGTRGDRRLEGLNDGVIAADGPCAAMAECMPTGYGALVQHRAMDDDAERW